jgi:hypothetical protein
MQYYLSGGGMPLTVISRFFTGDNRLPIQKGKKRIDRRRGWSRDVRS